MPGHKPAADLEHGGVISDDYDLQDMDHISVMGTSPMHGDGFEQVLSDDDGLAAPTVSWATVRSKDVVGANAGLCVPRQKAVHELDFFDVNPPACNRVATVPFRHVSFAETVEMVEFDPAVHAALSPVIEYNASAPNMAYRAHAAPAPMVEYDAALLMAHRAHATLAPWLSTTLHRLWRTGYTRHLLLRLSTTLQLHVRPLLPWWTGPVVKVVHVPQVQVVEKTIEIPQLQTIGNVVDNPEIQSVQSTQTSESLDIITPAPKEFVETVLHEIDEDLCRDDLEEMCYVARSRKRIWRCVWHGLSTPSDASKSERVMEKAFEMLVL